MLTLFFSGKYFRNKTIDFDYILISLNQMVPGRAWGNGTHVIQDDFWYAWQVTTKSLYHLRHPFYQRVNAVNI